MNALTGKDSHEAFLGKILDHCTCEVCSKPLTRADVVSVRRSDAMWLINIICSSCQARGLIFVLIKDAASVHDEADGEPVAEPLEGAVTSDDCTALHEVLRTFDGDCQDLIQLLG
jgi:hypothetical protein